MTMDTQNTNITMKLTAIDKALAMAKTRKETKGTLEEAHTSSKPKVVRIKLGAAEKAAANLIKTTERVERQKVLKSQRDERRLAKKVTLSSGKQPHMKKIEKAFSTLPVINDETQLVINGITSSFSAAQITAIALHLQHFNRVKATERALNQTLTQGQRIRIVSGVQKYVGMVGTVDRAQRIRCFVSIPGVHKLVYLFTSDVELIEFEPAQQATGTDR